VRAVRFTLCLIYFDPLVVVVCQTVSSALRLLSHLSIHDSVRAALCQHGQTVCASMTNWAARGRVERVVDTASASAQQTPPSSDLLSAVPADSKVLSDIQHGALGVLSNATYEPKIKALLRVHDNLAAAYPVLSVLTSYLIFDPAKDAVFTDAQRLLCMSSALSAITNLLALPDARVVFASRRDEVVRIGLLLYRLCKLYIGDAAASSGVLSVLEKTLGVVFNAMVEGRCCNIVQCDLDATSADVMVHACRGRQRDLRF